MIMTDYHMPVNIPHSNAPYEFIKTADPVPMNQGVRLGFQCDPKQQTSITLVFTNTNDVDIQCNPMFGKTVANRKASLYCLTSADNAFEPAVSFTIPAKETLIWPLSNIDPGLFVCSVYCGELISSTLSGIVTSGVVCPKSVN